MTMRWTLAAAGLAAAVAAAPALAEERMAPEDLVGTIWATEAPYEFILVGMDGEATTHADGHLYVEFTDARDGVLVARSQWFDADHDIGGHEHSVWVETGENAYSYVQAGRDGMPGRVGQGRFRITGEGTARYSELSAPAGRAGALSTTLTRVEEVPEMFRGQD